jgi:hypothetical protein
VDLGHEKYSVRCRRGLGSQWARKERVAAMKTFPFFLGFGVSPVSSLGLVKVNESVECRGKSSQRRGDAERGQMASRESEERGAWDLYARGDLGSV